MRTHDEIEGFLIELELPYERLSEGMWVLHDAESHMQNVVAYVTDTILNFRVKLFDLPESTDTLFRKLLELNASEMVHGAYGVEENAVVITGALELENLDINEVQAAIDSFSVAISTHHALLTELIEA